MFTGRERQGLRNGVNEISCRIGRTGRVGNDGRAFSFIDWTDDGKIQVIACNRYEWYKLFVQLTISTERFGAHLEAVWSNCARLPQTTPRWNLQGQQDTQGNNTHLFVPSRNFYERWT